jgi:hypothetical protein
VHSESQEVQLVVKNECFMGFERVMQADWRKIRKEGRSCRERQWV